MKVEVYHDSKQTWYKPHYQIHSYTDVHMNKLRGRADLEAKLSSGDQLCLSLYSHTILTTGSPIQFPCTNKSGPTDVKYEESV